MKRQSPVDNGRNPKSGSSVAVAASTEEEEKGSANAATPTTRDE